VGRGEGPGEFRGLSEGWLAKDGTLVAYDANLDRISRFALDGHLIDSRPVEISPPLTLEDRVSRPRWFDRFGDGSLLGQPSDQLPERTGRARAEFAFTRLALATLTYDTVSLALGPEWIVTVRDEGSLPEVSRVEFTSMSIAVAYDSTAFVSDNKDFWVEEVGTGGRVLRRFGRASEAGPVTRQDLEDYGTERLASAQDENQRRLIEQRLRDMAFADSWPAHGTRMLVDAEGNLWVALRPSAASDVLMWSVFDSLGVWLGDVPTPGQLRITEIQSDAVVGVWRDDLDVQTVRVYELRKPSVRERTGEQES